jgi:hypothetical protein
MEENPEVDLFPAVFDLLPHFAARYITDWIAV